MAVTILRLILLGLITIFIYYLKSYIKSNRAIEKSFRSIYSKAESRYSKRKEENEKIYFEEGNKENKSFFYNLDLIIERSGLRRSFSFLSTEIYILLTYYIIFSWILNRSFIEWNCFRYYYSYSDNSKFIWNIIYFIWN